MINGLTPITLASSQYNDVYYLEMKRPASQKMTNGNVFNGVASVKVDNVVLTQPDGGFTGNTNISKTIYGASLTCTGQPNCQYGWSDHDDR